MGNAHPSIVPYQTFDASDKKIALDECCVDWE